MKWLSRTDVLDQLRCDGYRKRDASGKKSTCRQARRCTGHTMEVPADGCAAEGEGFETGPTVRRLARGLARKRRRLSKTELVAKEKLETALAEAPWRR